MDWLDVLACPRCREKLALEERGLICSGCGQAYPMLGTLPCLVPDPAYWKALWLSRLEDYLEVTDTRIRFMKTEVELDDILPRTRARLLRLIDAKSAERARTVARLATGKIGLLVVYGAGAGRLAFDVHRSLSPSQTLALDLNPLPLLIADRLIRGESLELDEFPVSPTTEQCVVVRQHLRAPAEANEQLRLAIADAREPPLRPASVDAVLTPWFIDSIPLDLRETLALVNRVLRPGGLWIQIGPLNFNTVLSRTYLIEEVLELADRAGFRVLSQFEERVRYFDSPFSGSWREETIYCLAAEKQAEARGIETQESVPKWVSDPHLPIPVLPELMAMARTTAFTTMVMSQIDGEQAIADIAASLSVRLAMDEDDLRDQLRAFFGKLPAA